MDMHQKVGERSSHEARKQVTLAETKEDDANDSRDEDGKDGVFDGAVDDPRFANWADRRPGHKHQLFYGTSSDHDLKVIQSAKDVPASRGEEAFKPRAKHRRVGHNEEQTKMFRCARHDKAPGKFAWSRSNHRKSISNPVFGLPGASRGKKQGSVRLGDHPGVMPTTSDWLYFRERIGPRKWTTTVLAGVLSEE